MSGEVLDGVIIRPDRSWEGPDLRRFDRDGFCRRCQEFGPEFCVCGKEKKDAELGGDPPGPA